MPIFKNKNENFFKKWSPEMAYVLGFFAADGNLTLGKRGNHYIEFTSCDKEILERIKKLLKSNHKISRRTRNKKWKTSFRLQIGSKIIFRDLEKLGLKPKKSKTIKFPKIPKTYLLHFVRGYFDGDGNVWIGLIHKERKTPSRTLRVGFTSGSKIFLEELKDVLYKNFSISGFLNYYSRAYRLNYSTRAALSLYKFMYNDTNLYLMRKKKVFEKYLNAVVA